LSSCVHDPRTPAPSSTPILVAAEAALPRSELAVDHGSIAESHTRPPPIVDDERTTVQFDAGAAACESFLWSGGDSTRARVADKLCSGGDGGGVEPAPAWPVRCTGSGGGSTTEGVTTMRFVDVECLHRFRTRIVGHCLRGADLRGERCPSRGLDLAPESCRAAPRLRAENFELRRCSVPGAELKDAPVDRSDRLAARCAAMTTPAILLLWRAERAS